MRLCGASHMHVVTPYKAQHVDTRARELLLQTHGAPVCPPQVVLTAEAVVVWLDSSYRPTRVPADVKASLTHLHNAWLQTQKLGPGHA